MTITEQDWNNYIKRLSKMSEIAANKLQQYVELKGFDDRNALIEYANALVTKYGEGAAELACQMYDAIAEAEGVYIAAATPAETATMSETAKAINGSIKQSPTGQKIADVAYRLVKQTAADTSIRNAIRDDAEWAWIPAGDTCVFCLTLASNGWQHASKAILNGDHASHIHPNCDCQFCIRHDERTKVAGYNPAKYKEIYDNAEGYTEKEKLNFMRREQREAHKDEINAQKRRAYAIRKGGENG